MITKYKANQVDMIGLLHALNEPVVKKGKRYKWPEHNSIEFDKNMWYQHSQTRGGLPFDFLRIFFGMNDITALNFINEHYGSLKTHSDDQPQTQQFTLPPKASSNEKVFFYLHHFRNIDKDIVRTFANNGLIYQEAKTNNALFVGKNKIGEVKHIHKRNTHDSEFRVLYNQTGSQTEYSFNIIGKSSQLFVFESPIDLMSYISLNQDNWGAYSYLALCGLSDRPINRILKDYQNIKEVHLCLDNDLPGFEASNIIKEKLETKGYKVIVSPSTFKDYNEDLKFSKGLPAKDGFNNPVIDLYDKLIDKVVEETDGLRSISIKDIIKSYSEFLHTYKEDESISKYTYKMLLQTASFASKFILQQFTHLEQTLTLADLKNRLNQKNQYHLYINTQNNIENTTYQISQIYNLFKKQTFHSKEDKLHIINLLMNFTNSLVFTHVFLCLNERKKLNERQLY